MIADPAKPERGARDVVLFCDFGVVRKELEQGIFVLETLGFLLDLGMELLAIYIGGVKAGA